MAMQGLTEAAAKDRGLRTDVVSSELGRLEVYKVEGESTGTVKLVFDANGGKLLGGHIYGFEAGENIHVFAMAVRLG